MQLMIDLSANNDPAMLRRVAALLIATANNGFLDVAARAIDTAAPADVPSGTVPAPVAAAFAAAVVNELTAPVPPPPPMPEVPPPPPPEAVGAAPIPPPPPVAPAPSADVVLDKRGYPFDARIHGGTGTINKTDGLWRTKRGVDNAMIEAVELELREKGYGVAVPAAPVVPPPPPSVPAPPAAPVVPPPPPVIPPPPAANGAPAVPAGAPGVSSGANEGAPVDQFRVLMNTIGGHTGPDGKCRREIMAPIYKRLLGKDGGLPDFHKARDKIPELLVEIKRILAA